MAGQQEGGGQRPQPKAAPSAPLGSAGASSDPRVQQLLAERLIASSPGVDDAETVKAIDGKLAELGVTVGQ